MIIIIILIRLHLNYDIVTRKDIDETLKKM
jgi:hypothetical protein